MHMNPIPSQLFWWQKPVPGWQVTHPHWRRSSWSFANLNRFPQGGWRFPKSWGYPKMHGLSWRILWKWVILSEHRVPLNPLLKSSFSLLRSAEPFGTSFSDRPIRTYIGYPCICAPKMTRSNDPSRYRFRKPRYWNFISSHVLSMDGWLLEMTKYCIIN